MQTVIYMPKFNADTEALQGQSHEDILNAALEMADNGTPVFPIGKTKLPVWKNEWLDLERGQGGFKIATTDTDRVEFLFTDPRVAKRITGVGVPTGKRTGMTVVDVDCGKGKAHAESAAEWLDSNRTLLHGSTVVRTASSGLQYYCKFNPEVRNTAHLWALGVDARSEGGFVVVPPFMGYKYERITDPDFWPEPPPVPDLKRNRPDIKESPNDLGETTEEMKALIKQMSQSTGQPGSGWHTAARDITMRLVAMGWTDAQILFYVCQWTKGGFTHRETFEQIAVYVDGARRKIERENQAQTLEEARWDRLVNA